MTKPAGTVAAPFGVWERAIAGRYLRAKRKHGGVGLTGHAASFEGQLAAGPIDGLSFDVEHFTSSFVPAAPLRAGVDGGRSGQASLAVADPKVSRPAGSRRHPHGRRRPGLT